MVILLVVMVVIGYSLLALYEFKPLYREKQWHGFWVNAVLWTCSLVIALLLCFDVEIPSPEKPIRDLITLIFGR